MQLLYRADLCSALTIAAQQPGYFSLCIRPQHRTGKLSFYLSVSSEDLLNNELEN